MKRKIAQGLLYIFILTIVTIIPKEAYGSTNFVEHDGYLRRIVRYNDKEFKQICSVGFGEKRDTYKNTKIEYGDKDLTSKFNKDDAYINTLDNGIIKASPKSYDVVKDQEIDGNTENLDKKIRKDYKLSDEDYIEFRYIGKIENKNLYSYSINEYKKDKKEGLYGVIDENCKIILKNNTIKEDFIMYRVFNSNYILAENKHYNMYKINDKCIHNIVIYSNLGEKLDVLNVSDKPSKKIDFGIKNQYSNYLFICRYNEDDEEIEGKGKRRTYYTYIFKNNKLQKNQELKSSDLTVMSDDGYIWCCSEDKNKNIELSKFDGKNLISKQSLNNTNLDRVEQFYVKDDNYIVIGDYKKYITLKNDETVKGWINNSGKWNYINSDGTKAKDWKKINQLWYYFDGNFDMQTGWKVINEKWYKFDNSGAMKDNWYKEGNTWYYLEGGAMQTGWKVINGKWYKFDNSGAMKDNWYKEGNAWYYLEGGAMQTGWKVINGKWYKFDNSGAMKDNWYKEGNAWYYLEGGAMQTGWKAINGKWYKFDNSGAMKDNWYKEGNTWYYLEGGAMQTGWKKINNNWYYFNNSGNMVVNSSIDGWKIGESGVARKK